MTDKLLDLDIDYLLECIEYNEHSGTFKWKKRPLSHFRFEWMAVNWNKRYAGTLAGAVNRAGYLCIKIDYITYRANRLAWLISNGSIPNGVIDHVNKDKLDNRISNLRDVDQRYNSSNCKLSSANKTGIPGVGFINGQDKWYVQIGYNMKRVYLGTFDDFFEAVCARKSAENRYGFAEEHGR